MKRAFRILGIVAFMAMLCVPSIVWFGFVPDEGKANLENRELATFPDLSEQSLSSLPSSIEAWFSDNLPFKNESVRLKNESTMALFGSVNSSQVMVGNDGWLFYIPEGDENPLAEYKRTLDLSEERKAEFAEAFEGAQRNLAEQGIGLYMIVAPNKEIVYPDKMLNSLKTVGGPTRAERLERYFGEQGIEGYDYLLDAIDAGEMLTYYQHDDHWNGYGAYLGYLDLVGMMSKETSIPNLRFEEIVRTNGDLAQILNLGSVSETSYQPSADWYTIEDVPIEILDNDDPDVIDETVLLIGDSFRAAFRKYLEQDFSKVVSIHRDILENDEYHVLDIKPDEVVVLSPERNLNLNLPVLRFLETVRFE